MDTEHEPRFPQLTVPVAGAAYGVWAPEQPDDLVGDQDCGMLGASDSNSRLEDDVCTAKHPYICDVRECSSNPVKIERAPTVTWSILKNHGPFEGG